MPIQRGVEDGRTVEVVRRYRGSREINASYRGHVPFYIKPELPQITAMSVNPRFIIGSGAQQLTVSFGVTGSTHNELHRTIGDETVARPLTTSTSLTEQAPSEDAIYRLDCRNSEGAVSRSARFTRATAPAIDYFRNDGFVVSLNQGSQYAQLAWRVTGHPLPVVTINGGSLSNVRGHTEDDGTGYIRVDHAGPGADIRSVTYTLTATIRIDGALVGTATRTLTINWR